MTTLSDVLNSYRTNNPFGNDNAAIAMTAVAKAESGVAGSGTGPFENSVNPSSGALGVAQDLGARQTNLQTFESDPTGSLNNLYGANAQIVPGIDSSSSLLDKNTAFNYNEILNDPAYASTKAALEGGGDPYATEQTIIDNFERPGAQGSANDFAVSSAATPGLQAQTNDAFTSPNSSNESFDTTGGDASVYGGFSGQSSSPYGNLYSDPSSPGFVSQPDMNAFNGDQGFSSDSAGTGTNTGGASQTADSAGNHLGAGDVEVPTGSGSVPTTTTGASAAGGNPVSIVSDAPATADTASTNAANTAIGSAANATSTSITGSIETFTQSIFIRAMLIILGLVLLAVGVWSLFPKQVQTVARSAAAAA